MKHTPNQTKRDQVRALQDNCNRRKTTLKWKHRGSPRQKQSHPILTTQLQYRQSISNVNWEQPVFDRSTWGKPVNFKMIQNETLKKQYVKQSKRLSQIQK